MSINGIQNGVQTSAEFYSVQFSSSSQTNGGNSCRNTQFNDQQLQDIFARLSQAFGGAGNASNESTPNCGSDSGSNPIKDLVEQLVNILKSLKEQAGGNNQAQTPQNEGAENGGNFLEKLLTAPLDMAKSLMGGIFGGGGEGGGGLFGGLLGGIFGGK